MGGIGGQAGIGICIGYMLERCFIRIVYVIACYFV